MTLIPVSKLKKHCNPFSNPDGYPWGGTKVARAMVTKAIKEGRLESNYGTDHHIERIAYLVVNIDVKPIEIDVGCPCLGYMLDWMVLDGNHRLAAAIYRGDKYIDADVAGECDYAEELFGV